VRAVSSDLLIILQDKIVIEVYYAAHIEIAPPSVLTLTKGSTLRLLTSFSGFPTPSVTWAKDEATLINETTSTLEIKGLTVLHQGTYTITVRNVAGYDTSSCKVNIENPPAITVQPAALTTVDPRQVVSLCVEIADTQPYPSFAWYMAVSTQANNVAALINLGVDDACLVMYDVTEYDQGSYQVTITNTHGAVTSHAAIVMVNDPPIVTLALPASLDLDPNTTVVLKANFTGVPDPDITWMVGDRFPRFFLS
jgi:uncharacterized protein YjdB